MYGKRGADGAAAILQIRNMQQAVRSYSNLAGHKSGATLPTLKDEIIRPGKFIKQDPTDDPAKHPTGGILVFYSKKG